MAKKVPINVGLYDSQTSESLAPLKIVDFSDDCPDLVRSSSAYMIFTRATRGRIVVIDYGARIHWFVDELEAEMHVSEHNDTFGSTAKHLGLSKDQLRKMIEENAPA